jgi:hypothetical protein
MESHPQVSQFPLQRSKGEFGGAFLKGYAVLEISKWVWESQ